MERIIRSILISLFIILCGIILSSCSTQANKYSVQSLTITPAKVTLFATQSQQFTCTATYGDGTTRAFSPTWSVSNGEITVNGLYTAADVLIETTGAIVATYQGITAVSDITVLPDEAIAYPATETKEATFEEPTPALEPTSESVSTPTFPKVFSISENKILDSNGNEFVFRGVNIMDPAWMTESYYNKINDAYFNALADWNVNIIRIPVHPSGYTYYGKTEYLKILDSILDFAEKHEIYAIIDFHSIGFPPSGTYMYLEDSSVPWGKGQSIYAYTDQSMKDFWRDISDHYKNDNRVIFYELFNEPTYGTGFSDSQSWGQWKSKAEELVDVIRGYDSDAKIIVSGILWSYDLSYVLANPVNRQNIVYGTHPYPNQSKSYDEAFGALKATSPVFATEFGFDPNADGQHYQADTSYGNEVINYLENKKISWTVWHFSPVWYPALLLDWNSTYTPTTSGQLFKGYLRKNND